MIVIGINKYVTEMSGNQENHTDDNGDSTWKLVSKARPKQTPSPTSSSPTITSPYLQRLWIDGQPRKFDKNSLQVSKQMTGLLRHDHTVVREEDGAVEFRILSPMFYVCSALVKSDMDELLAKRRRPLEEVSVLCGSVRC